MAGRIALEIRMVIGFSLPLMATQRRRLDPIDRDEVIDQRLWRRVEQAVFIQRGQCLVEAAPLVIESLPGVESGKQLVLQHVCTHSPVPVTTTRQHRLLLELEKAREYPGPTVNKRGHIGPLRTFRIRPS